MKAYFSNGTWDCVLLLFANSVTSVEPECGLKSTEVSWRANLRWNNSSWLVMSIMHLRCRPVCLFPLNWLLSGTEGGALPDTAPLMSLPSLLNDKNENTQCDFAQKRSRAERRSCGESRLHRSHELEEQNKNKRFSKLPSRQCRPRACGGTWAELLTRWEWECCTGSVWWPRRAWGQPQVCWSRPGCRSTDTAASGRVPAEWTI